MDLLREMLEDGTVGPDDNMSSFERAFTSDIERLEKDAAPYRAMVRAGKAQLKKALTVTSTASVSISDTVMK